MIHDAYRRLLGYKKFLFLYIPNTLEMRLSIFTFNSNTSPSATPALEVQTLSFFVSSATFGRMLLPGLQR